jgi:hypothetical protein
MSRLTVMVAFLVPGLRRTQKALDTGGDAAVASGASEHTVTLSTQLATHVYNAAPIINRVAAEGSSFVAAKTSVVATAVAAVAAVAAPVAAYKVYDTTQSPPTRPPAAVAPPASESNETTSTTLTIGADGQLGTTPTTSVETAPSSSTSSTLPQSVIQPFAPIVGEDDASEPSSTTTTPPTTEAPAPEEPATVVHGSVGGDSFAVTGTRPEFSVTGASVIGADDGQSYRGTLEGTVFVPDQLGGDARAELTMTLEDGRSFRVRFRGTLQTEEAIDGATRWTMTGGYSIDDAAAYGLADRGTTTVVFDRVEAAPSSLRFELEGQQSPTT